MVESLSNNADKSDVDAEVEDHRTTEVHDQPQPPDGKGEAGGVAELDDNGTVRSGQIPSLALTNTFTVTNESDLTNLNTAEIGDVGIVTSQSRSYILTGDYSVQDNWTEFESPPAPVDDVNGQTGSVSLGAADVDAEPSGAVENHRTGETHASAQPPQSHDNAAHSENYTTPAEAEAAAPVDDVNGQTGSVQVGRGEVKVLEGNYGSNYNGDLLGSGGAIRTSGIRAPSVSVDDGGSVTFTISVENYGGPTSVDYTVNDGETLNEDFPAEYVVGTIELDTDLSNLEAYLK